MEQIIPLGKDEQKRLNQIIQQLIDCSESQEFRQPVDYVALGLEDYPSIITNPMDLGTVFKKLQSNKYKCVEQCLEDIQLIWDNCKTYNAYGSWIWKLSDKLEKNFKKYVKNYLPLATLPQPRRDINKPKEGAPQQNETQQEEPQEAISYNDKVDFANNLKQLQADQVGLIVHMIQNSSPNAFIEVDKEKYQIVVDNIEVDAFQKCAKQIEAWLSGEQVYKRVKTS